MTDVNGEVVLSALPAGTYTVRIELAGFKTITGAGRARVFQFEARLTF